MSRTLAPIEEHGTVAGWWKHRRRGTPACEACARAWADRSKTKRKEKGKQ